MPRAERLSPRLDSLLDAVFQPTGDPASLYWEIAGHLGADQLSRAQKRIRKTLREKGGIPPESAVLVACILHLTGFPAHRVLHFLSLYVPAGIRLALFELAVGAIFLGEPPIPTSLLYDLTQYTYLEKRLLARRSMEISDRLRGSLTPGVLLYLYLLSLRDDLSNENLQLIALIMKNCFPDLEVRTRIGGASLEEYGEIARAWKNAEQRSHDREISMGPGAEKRGFDRDSASFFLDKYFSDESLAEMRAAAPPPAAKKTVRRSLPSVPASRSVSRDETTSESTRPRQHARGQTSSPAVTKVPRKRRASVPSRPVSRLIPTLLAAAVVAVLLVSAPAGFRGPGRPSPAALPPQPAGVPAEPPARDAAKTTTYVVKPGDSLWKIFTSVRTGNPDHRGWMDFLSNAQSLNSLDDPDRLQPGKVLTISVDH